MAKLEVHPLMRTIVEYPDADLPRLVYADWLDEQEDPKLAILAEYIRLSIEAETMPMRSAERKPFDRRRYELLRLDRDTLCLPTPGWTHDAFTMRRGFPERLHCSLKRFAEGGAAVLESVPITSVAFVNSRDPSGDARRAPAAFARPEVIRLRGLFVVAPLTAQAFAALASNPNATNFRELDFQLTSGFNDEAAAALAGGAATFVNLTKLELWDARPSSTARTILRRAFGNRVTVNGQPA